MPNLIDPFEIKDVKLANRIVMPPMVTAYATPEGLLTDRLIAWYVDHARNGVGLIIVEAASISPDGKLVNHNVGVWDDAHIPGLSRLVQAVHAAGVPIVQQIVHGGARAFRVDEREERVSSSSVPILAGSSARPLTKYEIGELVERFAAAAKRVAEAGYDGVEIHAAHYYLLSQFLSPYTNKREDEYGGSLANRARFLLEVAKAIRSRVGPRFLIFCRLHGIERLESGFSTEDAIAVSRLLRDVGVDVLDVSAIAQAAIKEENGRSYLWTNSALPKTLPPGDNAPYAGRLKAASHLPVIAVGKLGDAVEAQRVLDQGQADLIAIGRQLIADPHAARKILAGKPTEIARCIECLACYNSIRKTTLKCSVNKAL